MRYRSLMVPAVLVAAVLASLPARANEENVGTSQDPLSLAPAQGSCKQGYVWREARPGDRVCVRPDTRSATAEQNRGARRLWVNGAYGPRTCVSGYVWREAFQGDNVCVTPEVREATRRDNELAARRTVR